MIVDDIISNGSITYQVIAVHADSKVDLRGRSVLDQDRLELPKICLKDHVWENRPTHNLVKYALYNEKFGEDGPDVSVISYIEDEEIGRFVWAGGKFSNK